MDDVRKVAILLQHLDPETRNEILSKLPDAQRSQIVSLLSSPIEVDAAELTEIVREYQSHFQQATSNSVTSVPESTSEESTQFESVSHSPIEIESEPESLAGAIRSLFSPPQLVELLASESDFVLSAIIAHLPQAEGRELFDQLDGTRQTVVAECLTDQEELAPAIAEEINEYLSEKHQAFAKQKKKGLSILSGLLSARGHATNEIIAEKLQNRDRHLLAQIRQDESSGSPN